MGIEQGQCLFSVLPCEILLALCQIGVGKVRVRVCRVRISEEIQLEDLNCILEIAGALKVLADDVNAGLGPQLGLRIFAAGVQ
jgi:hypothetical protein